MFNNWTLYSSLLLQSYCDSETNSLFNVWSALNHASWLFCIKLPFKHTIHICCHRIIASLSYLYFQVEKCTTSSNYMLPIIILMPTRSSLSMTDWNRWMCLVFIYCLSLRNNIEYTNFFFYQMQKHSFRVLFFRWQRTPLKQVNV